MNQALLVYRFATAFQGAIRIMLKRSCVAVLAATAVGLLFCAGAARGETPLAGGNKGVNGILDGGHLRMGTRPFESTTPSAILDMKL